MPNLRRGSKEPIKKPTVKKAFAGDLDADTIILRICFEMINFNSYASFPRIFRYFSSPMEPHCG